MLKYFDCEIKKYILPDIERLTKEIRPIGREGLKGCTIPLAMFLFSILDLFGFLIREGEPTVNKRDATNENLEYMFSGQKFLPAAYSENSKILVNLFRHGLMHQVFPKACGISKAGNKELISFENDMLNLNVDRLSQDVVNVLNRINLVIVDERDNSLTLRMNAGLDFLQQKDFEQLGKLTASQLKNRT